MQENRDAEIEAALNSGALYYEERNYDYLFLKCKLEQAIQSVSPSNKALVIGSSHTKCGILEDPFVNTTNLSIDSQDLYYDFALSRAVLERETVKTTALFIGMGYYIAFHDLSMAKMNRDFLISPVYYPLLHDAHHWENPTIWDFWGMDISEEVKKICESMAYLKMKQRRNYYENGMVRNSPVLPEGDWWKLSEEEKDHLGAVRGEAHGRLFKWKDTFSENKEIFRDYIHYLSLRNILPVVLVTPFTAAYLNHLNPEMIDCFYELLGSAQEDVHVVDCNQSDLRGLFEESDFKDPDHLNQIGAQKLSCLLAGEFSL
ncbi:MAG: hypothetical protein K6G16_00880 [Lachnospiraceae bacterium]|nr:hypothetical protein [Lachnospiraceae bacterium]